ncbi:hypothetical protein [Paenibacillus lemnae]|uniref:Uncharacterized protein n=1 Tax=Paenibacillus lemnae TaxID=1330551 RepID=A0A848MB35_PAELE|nr:hypothetical protein [Paenibacillus lemnae]NMO97193.1 hypothetical protein [Paenibacillus lemnae]
MESYFKRNKLTWIVLAPLFGGWLFNIMMLQVPASGFLIWTINIGFAIFWFWAGRQFAQMNRSKPQSFLMGNLLWILSFGLFVWQFVFINDESRNLVLALLSQLYVVLMVAIGARFYMLIFSPSVIDSTEITILTYILVLVVFAAGFIYETFRKQKKPNHTL